MVDLHKFSAEELDKFATSVCQAVLFLTKWCIGGIYSIAGIPSEVYTWKLPYTNIHMKSVIDLVSQTHMFYVWEEDAPANAQYVQWVIGENKSLKFLCCSNDVSLIVRGLKCLDIVKSLRYNELEAFPVYGLDYINQLSKRGDSEHDWYH